jgi:hypothetical protein
MGEGHPPSEADSGFVHKRQRRPLRNKEKAAPSILKQALNGPRREHVCPDSVLLDKPKDDHEHEVGGFNPERREEKPKTQVGPAPTDDPRGKAMSDIENKIDQKRTQVAPD